MPDPAPVLDSTSIQSPKSTKIARRSPRTATKDTRSWLQKIREYLHPGPDSTEELLVTLFEAKDNELIDAQSHAMLEGVIRMADMTAGDVMVAASHMELLDINAPFEQLLHQLIDTAHSRFPVFDGHRDNIIGVLMAKDVLKRQRAPELNLKTLLRPPVFVPESKGLNDLLRDFRGNRNHLALVIDEFGQLAGLITIEDVLEQIVGEIEDEFDAQSPSTTGSSGIFALPDGNYRIDGDATLLQLNLAFGVALHMQNDAKQFDTIGGLVAHTMGHVPKKGESLQMAGLLLTAMHTQAGRVRWFRVSKCD